MKWDDDEFKDLKYQIFDLLVDELDHHYQNLSLKQISDAIDDMFEKLIGMSDSFEKMINSDKSK